MTDRSDDMQMLNDNNQGYRPTGRYPARKRLSRLMKFRRNEDGAVAIEFALISPAFFFLIFVILETGLMFVAEEVLDNSVATVARMVRVGQIQNDGLTKEEFKDLICSKAEVFINCDSADFYVDAKTFGDFADAGLGEPVDDDGEFVDEGDYAFGGPNEVVVVRAYYKWKTNPIFGDISLSNLAGGKRLIGSFATFRNEPFPPVGGS
jgi:Flp pilus assembly protein TadG